MEVSTTEAPKRRTRRRQAKALAPPLTPEQTAVLLRGPFAKFAPDAPRLARYEAARDVVRRAPGLWDQHAEYLAGEASRLGIRPAFLAGGRLMHWGEFLSFWSREHARATPRHEARA